MISLKSDFRHEEACITDCCISLNTLLWVKKTHAAGEGKLWDEQEHLTETCLHMKS